MENTASNKDTSESNEANERFQLNILKDKFANVESNESNPLAFLVQWAERDRGNECYTMWYKNGDTETKAFYESLQLSKSADEQHVRLHLGRDSKRRKKEVPRKTERQ